MKDYMIVKEKLSHNFDEILLAIDNGVDVEIRCGAELDQETACKVAALGVPLIVDCWFWYDGVKETLENLLQYSPDNVVVNIFVQMGTIEEAHRIIQNIECNPKLMYAKVCLVEPKLERPDAYLDQQGWNELIVTCYDHNMNLSWGYEAAAYRYTEYLKEINDYE